MHRIFRVKAYEAEHGPHFNEEHARKAVSKMENEDGTRGPHWSVEETTAASELANCCCTTQRSIDAVNNNITKMGYENQLSVCNQTNNLVNTMNSNTLALRDTRNYKYST